MIRKVWVQAHYSSSVDLGTKQYIESHWEELSGSEAQVNALYSLPKYQGEAVHKKVSEPGTFGGRYEHNAFIQGGSVGADTHIAPNKNTDNWEDND